MRLISLSLRGAVGIERGLGLDQIDLDFDKFDPGLVAFVAKNGSGKSTVLENLHPFRSLVSRQGALQNHFFLRDSHRILSFEMNGSLYTIKLLVDAQAGKQESYLIRDGEPLNDGKTTTYDNAVREIFGSEELFFRSLFRSQNAESITDLRASERKALFVELLGLAHIQSYHEAAKAKANDRQREVESLRAKIDGIREQSGDAEALRAELAEAVKNAQDAAESLEPARVMLREAEEAERTARAAVDAFAGLGEKRRTVDEQRRTEEKKYLDASDAVANLKRKHAGEIEALRARITRAQGVIAKANEADAKLAELATARETVAEQAALKVKSDAAAVALGAAHRELAEAKAKHGAIVAEAERALDKAQSVMGELWRKHESEHKETERKRDGVCDQITRAEQAAALLADVPCNGMDMAGSCDLLASARVSRDMLPDLQAAAEVLRFKVIELGAFDIHDTDEAADQLLAECNLTEAQDARSSALDEIGYRLESLQTDVDIVGYDEELHVRAGRTVRDLESQGWERVKAEAEAASNAKIEAEQDLTATEARHAGEIAEANTKRDGLISEMDRLNVELKRIDEQRAGEDEARRDVDAKAYAAKGAEVFVRANQDKLSLAQETETRTRTQLEAAEKAEAQILELTAELDEALAVHGRWALLARATGKDGIQALELDAAGPNVSAIANQLLTDTFGSQFQIAFETTKLSADGKKQLESFEIKVFSEGTEQTIENLSGGQRVWIEAAISQAIAIYLRQKSGLDLRTSFLDEADGALDSDNAFRYLSMLRSAHELAGIHHTLLITHRQELLAHIPQQIKLVPGIGVEYVN